jgi:hypothetical protein
VAGDISDGTNPREHDRSVDETETEQRLAELEVLLAAGNDL